MSARAEASAVDPPATAESLIVEGLRVHQEGRLADAAEYYRRALRASPDHADALNLAGACAFALGETESAIRLISKAIQVLPTHFDAHLNLAEALERAGRIGEAIATCRKALRVKPDFPDAHARVSDLHLKMGAFGQALAHARVALALEPDRADALRVKGMALWRLQRHTEADAAYALAIEVAPKDPVVLTERAAFLVATDRAGEGVELYQRAVEVAPHDAAILTALAGAVEMRDGNADQALKIYDRALALAPRSADTLYRRASAVRDAGDFDGAEAGFRQALTVLPNHAASIHALVRMKRCDPNGSRRKQLARMISDSTLTAGARVQAGFALGDLLDQAGEPDKAFRSYTEANGLQAKLQAQASERYDRAEYGALADTVETRLALEYARDTEGWGSPTDLPVFVVGMPRSGTTLVGQICASHSEVAGLGELTAILNAERALVAHNKDRERLADWDAEFAHARAVAHAERLTRVARGARRVVDQTPLNLVRLGLIGALFPNARVIWCHRDHRDVVVSNYTMLFETGNAWSTDLGNCAFAARLIERRGVSYAKHSRLPILNVVYEELVADLDANVRRIVDFLGLDWEPGCLDFHKTDRKVSTPSSWQVRQPVFTSSIGRWRRFEKHLGPMFDELAKPL